MTPEEKARETIDRLLAAAGWIIQDRADANISAGPGVAIREFALGHGYGEADYLLFADGQAVGVIEAKKEGSTLTGFEPQTSKYSEGLPEALPAPLRPLPFCYQSTGIETRFTNLLEPRASSRGVFIFHNPETLSRWLKDELASPGSTLKGSLASMPELVGEALRPAQAAAISALEDSLRHGRRRALIQMASGAGKTYTACNFLYRLIKFAGARRILFLVDRGNLGRQTLKEFQAFRTPDDGRKFTELYNVQHLQSNRIDPVAKVCISTIQRLFSMLKGEELDPELEELSGSSLEMLQRRPAPISYNPAIPIETFDIIVTDECHRSIYNLWRQVLEYFDASLIGLTATPSKQTLGFFHQNLIMEYPFEKAVADGVNVDFDLYTIRTMISEHGSIIHAGYEVDYRDRQTRKVRWELADEDISYNADELDRRVVAPDQIRTVVRTFRDRLSTEIFPGRSEVPKTLIFAKDDSHADDIVQILREEFGKGNNFAQKITYRTGAAKVRVKKTDKEGHEYEVDEWVSSGIKPEDLLNQFRTGYNPRIAVTVDMIATGTDIRPLEIVMFMRAVKSRTLFEQMKGRGARTVTPTELQNVTPDGRSKDHFVVIDAVGLEPEKMEETQPLERKRHLTLDKLFEQVTFGSRDPDVLSSIASRLARLDRQLTPNDRTALTDAANGQPLSTIAGEIVSALEPDRQIEIARARATSGVSEPSPEQIAHARRQLLEEAAKPIAANPKLRNLILGIKKSYEQIIDTINQDRLLEAGPAEVVRERALRMVQSFEQFLREHRDEIEVLQILYSKPYAAGLSLKQVKALASMIEKPVDGSPQVSPDQLWRAYERLDASHVHGSKTEVAADLVNLIRFALKQKEELMPRRSEIESRFAAWLKARQASGAIFNADQLRWLEAIRDHIASSLAVELDDFELDPFVQWGGLGKAQQVFGEKFLPLLSELNEVLAA